MRVDIHSRRTCDEQLMCERRRFLYESSPFAEMCPHKQTEFAAAARRTLKTPDTLHKLSKSSKSAGKQIVLARRMGKNDILSTHTYICMWAGATNVNSVGEKIAVYTIQLAFITLKHCSLLKKHLCGTYNKVKLKFNSIKYII